ncbi:MAG TPA: hypothetical protein VGL42_10205 [Opitutaceae bacterium]|jgi:hypothetical protein
MSEDEAFLYIVANFLGSHRTETVSPALVLHSPSKSDRTAMIQAGAPRQVYIKVDGDGRPLGAFVDEQCTQPVPDGHIALKIGQLRFTPALDHGRAVPGVARLDLSI